MASGSNGTTRIESPAFDAVVRQPVRGGRTTGQAHRGLPECRVVAGDHDAGDGEGGVHHENRSTATNPAPGSCFPVAVPAGRSTPTPTTPALQELGIPTQAARTSAIRQIVLQALTSVTAQDLGYHPTTAPRRRRNPDPATPPGGYSPTFRSQGHRPPECRVSTPDRRRHGASAARRCVR